MAQTLRWVNKMRCTLIADRGQCAGDFDTTLEAALRAGVRAVHLREKQIATRELYELAARTRVLTRRYGALLILNDRSDIARAVGADGVHLGWQSLPPQIARRLMGPKALIGKSVHNLDETREALESGCVDYLFASPVFETPSKTGLVPTLGLEGLAAICRKANVPVIALGGIDRMTAPSVVAAGAAGLAVIRAIMAAADPQQAAADLLAALGTGAP
ncbi:MAG: thiamine phosphate synthase [Candidatus Sumerlaeia bacterium]|nr:thiamine phosphate synthase [Candidatus Sumerlaeia bacterium]